MKKHARSVGYGKQIWKIIYVKDAGQPHWSRKEQQKEKIDVWCKNVQTGAYTNSLDIVYAGVIKKIPGPLEVYAAS